MKISVWSKGGSGKSTAVSLLANRAEVSGYKVVEGWWVACGWICIPQE